METVANLDVRELLPQVKAPTLVMHVRDEAMVPSQFGPRASGGNSGRQVRGLPGKNHPLLEQDPGLPRFFEETEGILEERNLGAACAPQKSSVIEGTQLLTYVRSGTTY